MVNETLRSSLAESKQDFKMRQELGASQAREKAVLEAREVDNVAFEEATGWLKMQVNSLKPELGPSRESYVVRSIFRLSMLIPPQCY